MSRTEGWTLTERYLITILFCFLLLAIGIGARSLPLSILFGGFFFLALFVAYDDLSKKGRRTKPPFKLEYEPLNFDESPELSEPPPPPPEPPIAPPKSPYELKLEKAEEMRNNPEPAEKRMMEILNSSVTPNYP